MSDVTGAPTADVIGWGLTGFDPWDPRIDNDNIWDIYRAMRAEGPVVHSDAQGGFACITRYAEVRAAASDFRTFSSAQGVMIGRRKDTPALPLEYDRPEHTPYRKAIQRPFLANRIGAFDDLVRLEVRALIDDLPEAGEFDVVRDIAAPLPLRIISGLLGIPRGERQDLHQKLGHDLVHADRLAAERIDQEYHDFMREEVRARRTRPGDDLVGEFLAIEVDGRRFDETEIVRLSRAIALAGHHTTINGIASLLLRMADPGLRRRCLDDRGLIVRAVDESLRIDPPIHLEARTTTCTARIGDVELPEGTRVALLYASGNHDERVYPDPERLDLERAPMHLAFGHGIHKCPGENLARLEMRIVLEEVLDHLPAYRITGTPVGTGMVYGHHMGWSSLPASVC